MAGEDDKPKEGQTAPDSASNDVEMVDVHVASNEAVKSALEEAIAAEAAEKAAAASGSAAPAAGNADPSPATHTQKPNGEQAGAGASAQPGNVATQGAGTSTTAAPAATVPGNQADPRPKTQERELLIQNRKTELATYQTQINAKRSEFMERKKQLETGLSDRWTEDPGQAANDRDEIFALEGKLAKLDTIEFDAVQQVEAQEMFLTHVGSDAVTLDEMAELLSEEGLPPEGVDRFKKSLWNFMSSDALVQLGKRAIERKNFKQADSDRRVLATAYLALEKKLDEALGKSGQVVDQLKRNLNGAPAMTAQSSVSPRTAKEMDPTQMSHKAIKDALASSMITVQ